MTIPIAVGNKKVMLDVEVVANDIPLLVSKDAMKQMGIKLDFSRDTIIIDGDEINILCTSTGVSTTVFR